MERTAGMYMTKPVITIDNSFPLNEILRILKEEKISHLIVLNKKKFAGIISKNDVLDAILSEGKIASSKTYTDLSFKNILARDIMTKDTLVVSRSHSVEYAVELLLQGEFHCIPVVDDGILQGIITPYDLLLGYYHEAG